MLLCAFHGKSMGVMGFMGRLDRLRRVAAQKDISNGKLSRNHILDPTSSIHSKLQGILLRVHFQWRGACAGWLLAYPNHSNNESTNSGYNLLILHEARRSFERVPHTGFVCKERA